MKDTNIAIEKVSPETGPFLLHYDDMEVRTARAIMHANLTRWPRQQNMSLLVMIWI